MAVNDYATVADVKAMLPDVVWDSTYDALITTLITASSRAIDKFVNRKPGSFAANTDVTLYFDGMSRGYAAAAGGSSGNMLGASAYFANVSLWITELAAAPTLVAVAETGNLSTYNPWSATDYLLWPYNAIDDGRPYTRLDLDLINGLHRTWYGFRKGVQITGKFGYSVTPPADVKQATLIQIIRWLKRAQLNFQDLGVITDSAQIAYQNKIDSDVEMFVNHYRDLVL